MKYFIDTEFLEGVQTYGNPIFNFWLGQKQQPKPTIDLISIGIVAEDGREYYAISKDFNLKEAWGRFDIKNRWVEKCPEFKYTENYKEYWIRDNVLKPIFDEWNKYSYHSFTYGNMKYCINCIGKTNKQIAQDIIEFCKPVEGHIYLASTDSYEQVNIGRPNTIVPAKYWTETIGKRTPPEFYGYYCDYDWVVFCWLFGKMIDLPKGFPMYCIDLKQTLDEKANSVNPLVFNNIKKEPVFLHKIDWIKNHPNYPKQTNEHNALSDARFNRDLYNFLNTI